VITALKAKALIAEFTGDDKGIEQGLQKMYQQEGGEYDRVFCNFFTYYFSGDFAGT
jgi:hypothetical protein